MHIYLFTDQSFCLSIYLSIYLSVYLIYLLKTGLNKYKYNICLYYYQEKKLHKIKCHENVKMNKKLKL